MPTNIQFWTVRVELLSEGQVELYAAQDGELEPLSRRCSIQDALRELEVRFACSGEADFYLAVRAPYGPWCQLATRRWRLALYFITSQYERAFVGRQHAGERQALEQGRAADEPSAPCSASSGAHDVPSFVDQSGVLPALPQQGREAESVCAEAGEER